MDPRIRKFLTSPLWVRLSALGGVLALIIAIFFFLVIKPQRDELTRLKQQHASLERQYQEKKRIADNLSVYQKEYDLLEEKLNKSLKELPKEKEIPSLLTNVANLAKNQGLEVKLFKPLPENLKDFYAEVPVELSLSGTYHDTALFFEAVASMSRIVNIVNVDLKKASSRGEERGRGDAVLNIKCNAVTFRFVDRPPLQTTGNQRGPAPRR